MKTADFPTLHNVFLSNMNIAMYAWLAKELGVSSKALEDLEVGWAPVVAFKDGARTSYDGWFTAPQRDATGRVVGLSLRNQYGGKVSYPGSKLGCFYVINPNHRHGANAYVSGAHNWQRASAALPCPVCGKPDGCLISSENTADPKAVVCRKISTNRPTKIGWVHILKPEGDLSESVLTGTGPVITVEGMSDAAVAADLGFTAVGRPSNVAGLDILAELVRGREVIVVGESDRKTDGTWPGRDGMISAFQTVRRITHKATMVMPPPDIKDLRAWRVANGLTTEIFNAYVERHGQEKVDNLILENDNPLTVFRAFLRDVYTINKKPLLRLWEDNWYLYSETKGRYSLIKDAPIIGKFYTWSEDKQVEVQTEKGVKLEGLVCNPYLWTCAKQAALANVQVEAANLPVWVNGSRGPDPRDLVVFSNGILNVPAFLGGHDGYLLETTPDYFNTTALPVAFDPTATCPTWLTFLQSSLGDESKKIDLLQEWFGYCMTPDTSRQKMMFLRGVTGGGKGTVLHALQAVLGEEQSVSTTFFDLAGQFGLSPLVGKLACLIWDAHTPTGMDTVRGLEALLNISGDDSVQVNRKFKDQLGGTHLTCRVTIAANSFLEVHDHSVAMLRRLNVVEFQRTHKEHMDTSLQAKLKAEAPGIAVWALRGLKRLRDNGDFTLPESSRIALDEWRTDTSPTASFLKDCTQPAAGESVSRLQLYDCWAAWASEFRIGNTTKSIFFQRIRSNAPYVVVVGDVFRGLCITKDAARRYLGRP